MENWIFECKIFLCFFTNSFIALAEMSKIVYCFWNCITEKSKSKSSSIFAVNLYIHECLLSRFGKECSSIWINLGSRLNWFCWSSSCLCSSSSLSSCGINSSSIVSGCSSLICSFSLSLNSSSLIGWCISRNFRSRFIQNLNCCLFIFLNYFLTKMHSTRNI